MPIWGTIPHGLATPTGPETTAPPQSITWSSEETSRKLMFTPVTKFSPRASSLNPGGQVGEPESSSVEVEMHEPDNRQHDHGERHVSPAQRGGIAGRGLRPHHRQLEGAEGGGRDRQREKQQVGVLRSLLEPDEKMDDTERQARRGHHDPGDFDPVHLVTDAEGAVGAPAHSTPRLSHRHARIRSIKQGVIFSCGTPGRLSQRCAGIAAVARILSLNCPTCAPRPLACSSGVRQPLNAREARGEVPEKRQQQLPRKRRHHAGLHAPLDQPGHLARRLSTGIAKGSLPMSTPSTMSVLMYPGRMSVIVMPLRLSSTRAESRYMEKPALLAQ